MKDNLGVLIILLVVGLVILNGCATEKPSLLANMDKWQSSCANTAIERHLYYKNLVLLETSNIEKDAVAREKIARLNELILESDRLCGANQSYSQQL
jgi:hypothetical protein